MQNILDLHQALRAPITSKINFAEAQILQGKLYEDVKKNDLLVAQKSFDTWTESTRVQDTALFPVAHFDVYSPTKLIEFAGQVYAFRGQRGGLAFPTTPQSLGTVFRYDVATDTWTAIFNIPGRFDADRGTAIDATTFQDTMWFAIGSQDDTARNDNHLAIYFWNGTTFVHQANLNGTPGNSTISQHVFEVSLVTFNDRLWVTTASNSSSSLHAYNGQTWTNISNHSPDIALQRTGKLIVFENDLYWYQTNSSSSNLHISRYYRQDNPTATNYQWQFSYRTHNTGRTNWQRSDVVVYNHYVFFVFNLDHHVRIIYTPNMHDFYTMYATGHGYGRLGEDFTDGINAQWAVRWYKSSDNELYMIRGGTAARMQFFKIHDSLDNTNFWERFTIQYIGETNFTVGGNLYHFDFIEYQGYLLATIGQSNTIPRFYRIPLDIGNNNNNLVWTPAFQYTRSDDYEVNHYSVEYSHMQLKPRGVALQVYNGELYKAVTSTFFPFLLTYKFVNNKWEKFADPAALPAINVRHCAMEVHDGELYLAVANWTSGPRTLTYKFTGTAWIKLIDLDPFDTNNFGVTLKSFAGSLYLTVTAENTGNRIRVYVWNGVGWTHMPDLPTRPNGIAYMSVLEVHDNRLYLATAAWSSTNDIYLWRLNTAGTGWDSLTSALAVQPNNNTSAVALKSFNGNLYLSSNSDVNSRIWKWNGNQFIEMNRPDNWFNNSSGRYAMIFFEYKNRLYLIRGDAGAAPYFRLYSLIDEANGVWKSHKRWRPSTLAQGGYALWQFAAAEFGDNAYMAYTNDADNHRPGIQNLRLSPPGLVSVFPRADIKSFYGIGIANEDGLVNQTINIISLTPDYNLYKDNGWEQMIWQQIGA